MAEKEVMAGKADMEVLLGHIILTRYNTTGVHSVSELKVQWMNTLTQQNFVGYIGESYIL